MESKTDCKRRAGQACEGTTAVPEWSMKYDVDDVVIDKLRAEVQHAMFCRSYLQFSVRAAFNPMFHLNRFNELPQYLPQPRCPLALYYLQLNIMCSS